MDELKLANKYSKSRSLNTKFDHYYYMYIIQNYVTSYKEVGCHCIIVGNPGSFETWLWSSNRRETGTTEQH